MRDPRFLSRHGIKVNVPMAEYARIGTGGNADFFVPAGTAKELTGILDGAQNNSLKAVVIGNGSQTVFSDHGWRGLVVKNEIRYCDIDTNRTQAMAGGALPMADLVNRLAEAGCGGFEPLVAYAGSVGGAIRNNLRRGTVEISRHLTAVSLYSSGRTIEVAPGDLQFGPNESRLVRSGETVLGATFAVAERDPDQIRRRLLEATRDRLRDDPAETAAVRVFLDPPDGPPAAELIGKLDLAGAESGQAVISKKNPNMIVNRGGAHSRDVYELAQRMKHEAGMRLGVKLREAISWMGEW